MSQNSSILTHSYIRDIDNKNAVAILGKKEKELKNQSFWIVSRAGDKAVYHGVVSNLIQCTFNIYAYVWVCTWSHDCIPRHMTVCIVT